MNDLAHFLTRLGPTVIPAPTVAPVRLNLGAGDVPLEGYDNWDIKQGRAVYPLDLLDNSVDEIRASHVLEHFARAEAGLVLREWVRVLKPGGLLKIAVPDFATIAQAYVAGHQLDTEGYVMGGQTDANDFHRCLFDRDELERMLRACGIHGIHPWDSEAQDCAALPVSLNLAGWKVQPLLPATARAVMSVPRLGFMDNFMSAVELAMLGIQPRAFQGAFWGQCMQRALLETLSEDDPEFILTLDYDSVFSANDVRDLVTLMRAHPEVDAIAPVQSRRGTKGTLFLLLDDDGEILSGEVPTAHFRKPLVRARTAHFGFTLFRASRLKGLPLPWFWSRPNREGHWEEDRIDDDIGFWHTWGEAGRNLWIAPRVVIGHLELMIRWPDEQLVAIAQEVAAYHKGGRPPQVWR